MGIWTWIVETLRSYPELAIFLALAVGFWIGPKKLAGFSLRLSRPVAKAEMTDFLTKQAPAEIGSEKVSEISQGDGVKYILSDDSWLLIRPSGTEPVLRVYAEGRTQAMVKALLGYGEQVAKSVLAARVLGGPVELSVAQLRVLHELVGK